MTEQKIKITMADLVKQHEEARKAMLGDLSAYKKGIWEGKIKEQDELWRKQSEEKVKLQEEMSDFFSDYINICNQIEEKDLLIKKLEREIGNLEIARLTTLRRRIPYDYAEYFKDDIKKLYNYIGDDDVSSVDEDLYDGTGDYHKRSFRI